MTKTIFLLFIIVVSFFDVTVSECKQSYVTVCDTLEDFHKYPEKHDLTEVIIGSDNDKISPTPVNLNDLFSHLLSCRKLSSLTVVGIINRLIAVEGYCRTSGTYLKYLTLYGNKIETFERSQLPLVDLKKLSLINNKIENVKPQSLKYIAAEEIDLSDNLIETIEEEVFGTNVTKIIRIKNNKLSHIAPNNFPPSLQFLHLDYNNLRFIQAEVFQPLNLNQLTLSHNKLTSVPEISHMDILEFLDVSSNAISSISNEPWLKLKNLKYLDLSNNKISDSFILEKFGSPGNQVLTISLAYNNLADLNFSRVSVEKKELVLYGNPFACETSDQLKKNIFEHESECDRELWSSGTTPYCLNYYFVDSYQLNSDIKMFQNTVRKSLHHCDFPPYYYKKLLSSFNYWCVL